MFGALHRRLLPIFFVALVLCAGACAAPAVAQDVWMLDGNPLCAATDQQTQPRICPDGSGGAYVAWEDQRAGERIFLTHVTGSGAIATGWPTDGVDVSSIPDNPEYDHVLMPDGVGGVYVAWDDRRDPTGSAACVKRLNGDGTVAAGWPADGLVVSGFFQNPSVLLPDGAGGVLVIVSQFISTLDLIAYHVLPGGTKDPSWPPAGRSLLGTQPQVLGAEVLADGAGGLFVAWSSGSYSAPEARGLHFGGDGIADPAWPPSGLLLCSGGVQGIAPDGSGGGYVVVNDLRTIDGDLFVQRFTPTGSIAIGWDPQGVALCTATNNSGFCFVVSDGALGLIAAWDDNRDGSDGQDVYARRISSDGTSPPGWDSQGNKLCGAPFDQELEGLVSDSQGGAIACWFDHRGQGITAGDIYAQRIGPNGTLPSGWPADGQGICTNPGDQDLPVIATDGASGAIVAWRDHRNDELGDVYAGRVRLDAVTPVQAGIARTMIELDHVQVVWRVEARISSVVVERAAEGGGWESRGAIGVSGSGEVVFDDREVTAGVRYGYRIVIGGAGPLGEIWLQIPNARGLVLRGLSPNPARGALVASFALPGTGRCWLDVIDLMGRRVLTRDLGRLERGEHRVPLGTSRDLTPGVYLLVLSSDDRRATARACVLE